MAAPFVFLAGLAVGTTLGVSEVAFIGLLVACIAMFLVGISITRRERGAVGPGGMIALLRLLREGGWRFIIIPVAMITLILFGKR